MLIGENCAAVLEILTTSALMSFEWISFSLDTYLELLLKFLEVELSGIELF